MTIAIFDNRDNAQVYSDKIHQWLTKNRKGYNAIKWSDIEASKDETGLKWYVKVPYDYEILNAQIPLAKDKLTLPTTASIVDKLPVGWRVIEGMPIEQPKGMMGFMSNFKKTTSIVAKPLVNKTKSLFTFVSNLFKKIIKIFIKWVNMIVSKKKKSDV